jgi:hypothetical protein
MTPNHHPEYFEDCTTVPAGRLVVLDLPHLNNTTFAISCDNKGTRMFVVLGDITNEAVPAVAAFDAKCVSLGNGFVVGFDASFTSFVQGHQAPLGSLVVTPKGTFIAARTALGGTQCFVNLATGEVTGRRDGAAITSWSISLDSWNNGKPVVVFKRPAQQSQ